MEQDRRQRADSGGASHLVDECAKPRPAGRIPQEERGQQQPRQPARIVPEIRIRLQQRHRGSDVVGSAAPGECARHPGRHEPERPGTILRHRRLQRREPLCQRRRGPRIAEVVGGVHRIRERDRLVVRGCRAVGGHQQKLEGLAQRAGARRDRGPHLDLSPVPRAVGISRRIPCSFVEQPEGAGSAAGRPCRVGGAQQSLAALIGARRQARRPLERPGRDRVGGTRDGIVGGTGEQVGDGRIGMPRGLGEMPGAPVRVRRGSRLRGGPMRRMTLLHRCAGVHRGAQQRMPELHAAPAHRHQPTILGFSEQPDIDSERVAGGRDEPEVRSAHRCDEQGRTAAGIQVLEPPAERVGDRARHAQGQPGLDALDHVEVGGLQFEQSERIAGGRAVQHPHVLIRCRTTRHERARRLEIQPADRERGQSRHHVVALGGAHAEECDHRVGRQPPRCEDQGARRRRVGQMQVVDHHCDGAVLGVPADQAQNGCADREPIARIGRVSSPGKRQSRRQCIRLHRRNPVECAERGAHELQQRPERDLALRLESGRTQHPHLRESPHRVVEQRGLPDPGLADHSEHAARSQARGGHEPIDRLLFGQPTHQHSSSVGARQQAGGVGRSPTKYRASASRGCGAEPHREQRVSKPGVWGGAPAGVPRVSKPGVWGGATRQPRRRTRGVPGCGIPPPVPTVEASIDTQDRRSLPCPPPHKRPRSTPTS